MARPSGFNQEIADEILERIAEGETLKSICEDPHMPNPSTVFRWEVANPEFCKLVARARETGSHMIVAEAREIADDGRNDWMEKLGRDGQPIGWQLNGEHVQRSRLRVDQRWREAEALAPRSFGKKAEMSMKHSGALAVVNIDYSDVTDAELVQEILMLVDTGRFKPPGGVEFAEISDDEDEDPYGVG